MLRAAPSKGAVRGLSYPSTPDFSGCQLRQVSPCSPRTLPCAQKPSSAARVALFRYAPRVGLSSDFRWITGHRGIASPAPFPRRRFRVAQHAAAGLGRRMELHHPAPVVAQRARLEALRFSVCSRQDWRVLSLPELAIPACLSACGLQVAACPLASVCVELERDKAGRRVCVRLRSRAGLAHLRGLSSSLYWQIAPRSAKQNLGTSIRVASPHPIT